MTDDIRWKQRFNNYLKAFRELKDAAQLAKARDLSKLEKQGVIQGFEYTHELAWNVMKDYLNDQGFQNIIGSKDATRQAFKSGLITDGEDWMNMIKARNLTSHLYDETLAEDIFRQIVDSFYQAFETFTRTFTLLYEDDDV